MSIHSEDRAPAPEATREADPRLAARCPSFALGGQGRRIHCSRLLGHKGSHSFMPGYVPGEESEDQPYYSQTVVDELLVAERAAQARENETLRADRARLERELADLRQMYDLRGRMNDELRGILNGIYDVMAPHISTLCAARAPEPQP